MNKLSLKVVSLFYNSFPLVIEGNMPLFYVTTLLCYTTFLSYYHCHIYLTFMELSFYSNAGDLQVIFCIQLVIIPPSQKCILR